MSDGNSIRITVSVTIEGDAGIVTANLAATIASAIGQATAELPKPEPVPMSRPENFPDRMRPLRRVP
jgi:hypothetical protein